MGAGSDLGLLLLATFYHPDTQLRVHLKQAIQDEILTASVCDENKVYNFLQNKRGTSIEPFSLDGVHLDVATLVLRFALAHQVTRFRIVGQDTLGNMGGLIVTSNLKGFYQERFALSKKTVLSTMMDRFVAPARIPHFLTDNQDKEPMVTCGMDESGYYLEVANIGWQDDDTLASKLAFLQAGSEVYGKEQLLDRLGMQFTFLNEKLYLRPTSPEGMIQFTALMHQGAILRFVFEAQQLFVRLVPPDDAVYKLSTLATQRDSVTDDWVAVPFKHDIALSDDVYRCIAKWVAPHNSWVHPTFVEAMI